MQNLMNIHTGSVDTQENWMAEFDSQDLVKTWGEFSKDLVEVEWSGVV